MRVKLNTALAVLIVGLSLQYSTVCRADESSFTSMVWIGVGITGFAIGIGAGSMIFSTVGVMSDDKTREKKAQLLELYLQNSPSELLEAASWSGGGMLPLVAQLCDAHDERSVRRVRDRLKEHRQALVESLEVPTTERGAKLLQLWCAPLDLGARLQ